MEACQARNGVPWVMSSLTIRKRAWIRTFAKVWTSRFLGGKCSFLDFNVHHISVWNPPTFLYMRPLVFPIYNLWHLTRGRRTVIYKFTHGKLKIYTSQLYQKTHNMSGSGGLRSLYSSCWSWCEAGSPPGAAGSLCSPVWLPLRVTWQETMEKIFFRPLKYNSVSASHENENLKVTDTLLILMFQINSDVPLVLFSPFRQVILKVL